MIAKAERAAGQQIHDAKPTLFRITLNRRSVCGGVFCARRYVDGTVVVN